MNRENDELSRLRRDLSETQQELTQLKQRHEQLLGPVNPNFDPVAFKKILTRYFLMIFVPALVLMELPFLAAIPFMASPPEEVTTEGLPWIHIARDGEIARGVIAIGGGAIGLLSFGGLALGMFAFGGAAIGVVAIGGGALGLIALGGGAVGFLAFGGGAAGYIALGGGAYGKYVLAGDGSGTNVLTTRRQDRAAAEFFIRYLPRLAGAFPKGTAALE